MKRLKSIKVSSYLLKEIKKKKNLQKILETNFGNSNCIIESNKYQEFLEFDERKYYEFEFQRLSNKIGLDYLYISRIKDFQTIKFYYDNYPLLNFRKKILYFMKYFNINLKIY